MNINSLVGFFLNSLKLYPLKVQMDFLNQMYDFILLKMRVYLHISHYVWVPFSLLWRTKYWPLPSVKYLVDTCCNAPISFMPSEPRVMELL